MAQKSGLLRHFSPRFWSAVLGVDTNQTAALPVCRMYSPPKPLQAEIYQRRVQPSFAENLLHEAGTMFDNIVLGFKRHWINRFDLERFQETHLALALSRGLPLRDKGPG